MRSRSKRPCPYGEMCVNTDASHHSVYEHVKLPGSPSLEASASSSSLHLEPMGEPSPVMIDLCGSSSVSRPNTLEYDECVVELDLVSPSPKPAESKAMRLKKRKLAIESESASDSEGLLDFGNILSQGAFKASPSGASTQWIDMRRTKPQDFKNNNADDDDEVFLASFSDEELEDFECPQCALTFSTWEKLEDHTRHDHASVRRETEIILDQSDSPAPKGRLGRLKKRNAQKLAPPVIVAKPVERAKMGPQTMEELLDMCKTFSAELEADLLNPDRLKILEQPDSFPKNRQLKSHQIAGLNWLMLLHERNRNGILADEMGLGKTVQAIALLTHLKEQGKDCSAIIVVPASVIANWFAELERWSPLLNVVMYYGTVDERFSIQIDVEDGGFDNVDVYLTTYSTVVGDENRRWLKRRNVQYLIVDEAHEVRNADSLRHKALVKLGAARRLLLTGTPLHNNLQELLTLLYFLNPDLLGNFKSYRSVMADVDSGIDAKTAQENTIPAIRLVLNPFLLRRTKEEVLQLPAKTRYQIKCSLSSTVQENVYRSLLQSKQAEWNSRSAGARSSNNIVMALRQAASHAMLLRVHYEDERVEQIARILKRRVDPYYDWKFEKVFDVCLAMSDFQLTSLCWKHPFLKEFGLDSSLLIESSGKIQMLMRMIRHFQSKGKRVLVFSQFTKFLSIVEAVFANEGVKYLRLDGSTPVLERQELIDEFDSDPSIDAFLLSTKAGGVGITLVAACCVIFLDLSWNPASDRQAEDRCHRIGQEKEVSVYRFITEGTIDEAVFSVQNEKMALHNGVLLEGDDEEVVEETASASDVKSLLTRYFANANAILPAAAEESE